MTTATAEKTYDSVEGPLTEAQVKERIERGLEAQRKLYARAAAIGCAGNPQLAETIEGLEAEDGNLRRLADWSLDQHNMDSKRIEKLEDGIEAHHDKIKGLVSAGARLTKVVSDQEEHILGLHATVGLTLKSLGSALDSIKEQAERLIRLERLDSASPSVRYAHERSLNAHHED